MMTSSNGNISALLAICAGNSPVTGEFPSQRPVTQNCDVFFDLRLNKRMSKWSWGWWFATPLRPLWRHCNETSDQSGTPALGTRNSGISEEYVVEFRHQNQIISLCALVNHVLDDPVGRIGYTELIPRRWHNVMFSMRNTYFFSNWIVFVMRILLSCQRNWN